MRMLLCFLLLLVGLPPCAMAAQAAGNTAPIVVGILAYRGETVAEKRWGETIRYLEERSGGRPIEARMLTLAGMRTSLDRNELDFLLTNPGNFRALAPGYGLSPIATLRTDRDGFPATGNRFGAVIFTSAAQGGINNIADLADRRFGAVAPEAFGGFLMAAHVLDANGVDPWQDLAEIRYFGFPQDRIVEAVLAGSVDAGTVRTGLIETMISEGRLDPGSIRVLNPQNIPDFNLLLSTRVFPEWIFGATRRAEESTRRHLAIELLSMPESHPAAVTGGYGGWTTFIDSPAVEETLDFVRTANRAEAGFLASPQRPLTVMILGAILLLVASLVLVRSRRADRPVPADMIPDLETGADEIHVTPRECEVLCHIETGKTTKSIAKEMGISPKTVEYHRAHLMKKFQAQNVAELVHKARFMKAAPR